MKTAVYIGVMSVWLSAVAVFGQALVGAVNELALWPKNKALAVEMAELKLSLPEGERQGFNAARWSLPKESVAGRMVRMSVEIRGEGILQGVRPYYGGKIQIDALFGKTPQYYALPVPLGTFAWQRVERVFYFPADLSRANLQVGFQESAGTMWLRDFRLEALGWPIDLTAAANMAFADEVAGDGQGGWSDQGPENDARVFVPLLNALSYKGLPFMPAPGEGKAVLTMRSPKYAAGLPAATVAVRALGPARYLYVLHALCWGAAGSKEPVGMITVVGSSGRQQQIVVRENLDVADWWNPRHVSNGGVVLTAKRADGGEIGLYGSKFALNADLEEIKEVRFLAQSNRAVWTIVAMTASAMDLPLPHQVPYVVTAGAQWRPLRYPERNVRVDGSALDVSGYLPVEPAGAHGRVIINDQGRFAFADKPGQPVRFRANSIGGGAIDDCGDKAGIELFCREMRKNGFNMIRTHFLDSWLVRGGEKDGDIQAEQLDHFDYLVYCLKQHGIYLNFDLMTNFIGYTPGSSWNARLTEECYKGRLHFDPAIRKNWRDGAERVLCHVNPYTNTRLIDEPLLAMTHGYNEQEFGFMRPFSVELVRPAYQDFLRRQYETVAAMNKDLGTAFRRFEDVACFSPEERDRPIVRVFMQEVEIGTLRWYKQQLQEMGYDGPLSNYNMLKDQHYNQVRRAGDYVSINSYHDHPWDDLKTLSQQSAIGRKAAVFRDAIATRQQGMPMVVTEYASVFWNQYRHDQAFVFSAYAAFQDVDVLTAHANSVSVRTVSEQDRLRSFTMYNDPMGLAAEYLAFFMFLRGDVASAQQRVRVAVDMDGIYDAPDKMRPLAYTQSQLALLTGFAIDCVDKKTPAPALAENEMAMQGQGGANVITDLAGFSMTVEGEKAEELSLATIAMLKQRGWLGETNRSDGKGIFENASGEIYLDATRNFMCVDTPRLQGVSAEAQTRWQTRDLDVREISERGCLAVVSVDGLAEVRQARRLTLVYATDALNSTMTFASDDKKTVVDFGTGPTLLKSGRVTIAIANVNAQDMAVYALDLAGNRVEEITTKRVEGEKIVVTIDTEKLQEPTMFFEMVCE